MLIKRSQVVEYARSWKDVPYRHQGRSRLGVDCAGILVEIARMVNIEITDVLNYSREPSTFSLKEQMDRVLCPIDRDDILPGDALLFKIDILPQHVAIVSDYLYGGLGMIHAYTKVKKVVEHRLNDVWMHRLIQAYRIPGIVEG